MTIDERVTGGGEFEVLRADIARVERMIARHGDRVLRRFLTERERAYVAGKARPAMHIAARIAAKEAAYKALQPLHGARAVSWQDLRRLEVLVVV